VENKIFMTGQKDGNGQGKDQEITEQFDAQHAETH
jgi:hypothetical protein